MKVKKIPINAVIIALTILIVAFCSIVSIIAVVTNIQYEHYTYLLSECFPLIEDVKNCIVNYSFNRNIDITYNNYQKLIPCDDWGKFELLFENRIESIGYELHPDNKSLYCIAFTIETEKSHSCGLGFTNSFEYVTLLNAKKIDDREGWFSFCFNYT